MRIEAVISIRSEDSVGPTRLHLLTASSAKLPAVIIASSADGPAYFVYDVAALQAALAGALSATTVAEVLDLAQRAPVPPVPKSAAATAAPGTPVEDGGRLIGVIALDPPQRTEPTEADMQRGAPGTGTAEGGPQKKGLWKRLTGSAG